MAVHPFVVITEEMLDEAMRLIPKTKVNRTIASEIDTLTGHLGEFAFAQFLFNDWRKHRVGANKGETDFENIEIKTSSFPMNPKLHLLVREDYAEKRKPSYYVQIVLDVPSAKATEIEPGTRAYLCGFTTAEEVNKAPLRDFGSKKGNEGGYKCRYIPLTDLQPVAMLKQA